MAIAQKIFLIGLIVVTGIVVTQGILPAPSWFNICSGTVCNEQQQDVVSQQESFYYFQFARVSYALSFVFFTFSLFVKRKDLRIWMIVLATTTFIAPNARHWLVEYGALKPFSTIIILYFGLLVGFGLTTNKVIGLIRKFRK